MAKISNAEFIAAIKEMSVLELNELVKAIEEEFGVTAAAPVAAPKAAAPAPAASTGAGSIKIEAGAAGKVFKLEKKVGDKVEKGDAVLILEAMKMEIPVVAPEAGTVASIDVAVGDTVESGALLATLN